MYDEYESESCAMYGHFCFDGTCTYDGSNNNVAMRVKHHPGQGFSTNYLQALLYDYAYVAS